VTRQRYGRIEHTIPSKQHEDTRMSTDKQNTTDSSETGSTSRTKRSKDTWSKTLGGRSGIAAPRSEHYTRIEERRGYIFTYGTPGQQSNYIRAKKALADHVGTKFKFAKELYKAINGEEEIKLVEPEPPTAAKPSQIEMKRYEVLCNRHFAKVDEYEREKTKLFRTIMGQCSPTLRDKLESMQEFPRLEETDNFIGLLKLIHSLVYGTNKGQYQYWKMQVAIAKLTGMKQEPKEPTMSFAERFLTQVEATESLWGPLLPTLDKMELPDYDEVQGEDAADKIQRLEQWKSEVQGRQATLLENDKKARDKFLACLF
jgi:hypothetical protein